MEQCRTSQCFKQKRKGRVEFVLLKINSDLVPMPKLFNIFGLTLYYLQPAIYKNYAEIQILPYEFPQYLQTIGFVDWQTIGTPFHTQKGNVILY